MLGRIVVLFLFATLAVAPIGSRSSRAQEASPVTGSPPGIVDGTIDLDGRSIHYACAGSGRPTVVYEPGGPFLDGGTSIVYGFGNDIAAALGTSFCSYDRAGSGQSDPHSAGVHTLADAAADLNAVLASTEMACPCVVIGESLGGAISLLALEADGSRFAGLVLLDAAYPGAFDELPSVAPSDAEEVGPEWTAYNEGENEEQINVTTGFGAGDLTLEPPGFPVVVVTHGAGAPPPCQLGCSDAIPIDALETMWQAGQARLAESLDARLVVAENAGHTVADENTPLVLAITSAVIAAIADPGSWSTPFANLPQLESTPEAPYEEYFVDIGGRSLHVECAGEGDVTVLYETAGPDPEGGAIVITVAGEYLSAGVGTRICAYDRAGSGGSDPDPRGVRTFQDAANDLVALIASPEVGCPCVLLGDSMGSSIVLLAHQTDATNVAGMVLLDAAYEGYFDDFASLAPAGSDEEAGGEKMVYAAGENEEQLDLAAGFREVLTPAEPASIPVIFVTHGEGNPPPCNPGCSSAYPVEELESRWQAGQIAMAEAYGARLVVAEGIGHFISEEDPEFVFAQVRAVTAAIADPVTWATPEAN